MSDFLCNFARYLLNMRDMRVRATFDYRTFIARSSHVHRTFIARTFTCKVLVNNVRVSCSTHALFLRKVKNYIN